MSAFRSDYVTMSNGLIVGAYSRHGVGVIADAGSDNMTVRDVDVADAGAGFAAWSSDLSRMPHNFRVERGRVRDGRCQGTWKGSHIKPASGGIAFSLHKNSKNGKFINSIYANHCRSHAVDVNNAVIKDIKERNFTLKSNPTNINFPWLK